LAARRKTEGSYVRDFVEAHCRITRGEGTGELVKLVPFQRRLIDDLFELGDDGRRRYRQALVQMPRKNSKTFLSACLALYDAVTGEPGGEVYFCAGDRKQASRAFDEIRRMVEMDPELSSLFTVYRQAMEIPATGTVLRVLSSEAGLQQGLSPSWVVFDEIAGQPDEKLWAAMTLGSGTRTQPMVVGISTPGYSKDSLLWRLYEHGKRIQAGEVEDPTFFFRAWEPADPECDWRDPKVWRQTNPALGHFLHVEDFEATVVKTPENDFRRFRLGQWTSTKESALPFGAWDECADPDREVPQGAEVVLGLDPSFERDATALIGATVEERPHLFVVDIWEQSPDDPGWRVPVADVLAAIREMATYFTVREVAFDPPRWGGLMAELETEGLADFIVSWPTATPARISPAWLDLRDAVLEGRLTHDGDPRLSRHIANMVLKTDRLGPRPIRDRNAPRAFVDGGIAAIIAHDRAMHQEPPVEPLIAMVGH
jgi:phage terminase large subunit-like protein